MSQTKIHPSQPRTTAQIRFSNGQVLEGPLNTTIEEFVKAASFPPEPIPVACLVDGQLRELTYHADRDINVRVLTLADGDGMRVYRRSLAFLLVAATNELFPNAKITIDYGLNFGALYCEVEGRPPFTEDELKQIEAYMLKLVDENVPIIKERISVEEARRIFEETGAEDRLSLLKARRKSYLTTYTLKGFRGYMHGYKVPSTGYLRIFALDTYYKGFVLRYPRTSLPDELQPRVDYPKLVKVFDEYGNWMRKLDIHSVGRLNDVVRTGDMLETILVAEALQEQRIAQIATHIASIGHRIKLVLISGPSSAGKTTFSKRLSIQLLAHGFQPIAIGLDDFIVNRSETPRDEEGDYDYESLYSLRLDLLNQTLLGLMRGESVVLPRYNFFSGRSEPGETIAITDEQIILIEGIHGMNPELVSALPAERIFRVYVSALTQLNLDRQNRVPTTDTRLVRRILRDAQHRGYTAKDTIMRWPKVRRGEYTWIFPYQENADIMFNSALVYELAVMKPMVEPLLRQIEPGKPEHIEANRLLSFLQWFEPCPSDLVPTNSLLREFIGGSVLRPYKPGDKLMQEE
ncbi:MAG: nucleoside kinase [Anaerolineae bacterium]|nr:nucleoside kinase [Anaerolineae bacterium]